MAPLAAALATPATATNLIANPGVETASPTSVSAPSNWAQGNWGTNSTTFSYNSSDAHSGSYGVGVTMTSYTSGDAKWYFAPVNVTAGSNYIYSDYYQSSVPTDVVIQYSTSSGSLSYVDLGQQAASPSTWAQTNDSFVVPAGQTSLTVFHLISSVGSLKTDDFSLTAVAPTPTLTITSPTAGNVSGTLSLSSSVTNAGSIASVQYTLDGQNIGSPVLSSPYSLTWNSTSASNGSHSIGALATPTSGSTITATPVTIVVNNSNPAGGNLIPNPTLATANPSNSSSPQDWSTGGWGTNTVAYSYLAASAGYNNMRAVEVNMTKYTSGDAKWYFTPVNITAGATYDFSDYYKSSVPTDVVIQYSNASGALSYVDLGQQAASATAWAHVNDTFVVPAGQTQMTVFHLISAVGTLTTSDFSLTSIAPIPSITITSPIAGASLSGSVTLSAAITNVSSIASVQYTLDGKSIGSPVVTSPYNITWNSAATTNGAHSIGAVVTPTSGSGVSATPVNVEVNNSNPVGGNLIPNPLATTVNPSNSLAPQDWTSSSWGTNTVAFSYLAANSGYSGSRALEVNMTKYTSGDGKWYFTPQNITADTQYKYSEYYESNVASEVDAVFNMSDGTTVYQIIGLPAVAATWTNFTSEFVIPQGTVNVTIYHFIEKVGTLKTSDFSMTTYKPVGFNRALVTLTFDDGYDNMYTQALPLLQADGYDSTQFIISSEIGQTGYMTSAQIKTMYTDGNEIASHTVTHTDLTTETSAQVLSELSASRTALQAITATPITDFAYPFGEYNTSVISQVKSYYSAARGVEDGLNSKDNFNAYDLKVQNVYDTTTTAQIADWVAQAQATKTWLIIVYHSVDPDLTNPADSGIYNITPTQLSAQLGAIKSSGVTVETMKQALAEVKPQI
jgi:peptidoglycan/xylan/chitin deacetylase (PgdA/CDA1 family)